MKKNPEIMRYNWQNPDWPQFHYNLSGLQDSISRYLIEAGSLTGDLDRLPENLQTETLIDIMVSEALKSSEIEGEKIDYNEVRSSIRKELGIPSTDVITDARALGIAKLIVSLRQTFNNPLTKQQLFDWHSMLFSDSNEGGIIDVGLWRQDIEPMHIVSGPMGHEIVHFEAPPSKIVILPHLSGHQNSIDTV
jgi:Fic family protein